jgi:hypothetical protein
MFNRTKVTENLIGLVGWKQSINPDYPTLDTQNLTTSSGRVFNSNAFVKLESIFDTEDYDETSEAQFNASLLELQKTAVTNVMDEVFNKIDYIDRQLLYQNPNNKTKTDNLPNGFVGYRIYQNLDKTQAFEITRCLLEFEGAGDITLLLYNSAKSEPLFTKDVTISSNMQEVVLDWRLDNTDSFYKGEYYFGYLTNGVSVVPVRREWQSANVMSCITGVSFDSIEVDYTPTTNELFDLDDIESSSECWGLNPDVTVFDDYTDLIIQNKFLFSYAIELQGQIKSIEKYIATLRSNANERITNDYYNKIIIELDGLNNENIRKKGLREILVAEISKVKEEIKKLRDGYFANGFLLNTLS